MILFTCSNEKCGYSKRVDEKHLGKKAKCPKCKTVTRIIDEELVVDLEPLAELTPPPIGRQPFPVFDESRTFAYKGDFLGMTVDQFVSRHQGDNPAEFSMVWCKDIAATDYETYGIEGWTANEPRVQSCAVVGARMTIVGVPLRVGLYVFLDNLLHLMSLETKEDSLDVFPDIYQGLTEALGTDVETENIADIFEASTWERPDGHLSSISQYEPGSPLNVRYINQLLLDKFNAVRESHTASDASKDL